MTHDARPAPSHLTRERRRASDPERDAPTEDDDDLASLVAALEQMEREEQAQGEVSLLDAPAVQRFLAHAFEDAPLAPSAQLSPSLARQLAFDRTASARPGLGTAQTRRPGASQRRDATPPTLPGFERVRTGQTRRVAPSDTARPLCGVLHKPYIAAIIEDE